MYNFKSLELGIAVEREVLVHLLEFIDGLGCAFSLRYIVNLQAFKIRHITQSVQ